jgi:hypothetical protein
MRTAVSRTTAVALALLLAASGGVAGEAPPLIAGSRVRVTAVGALTGRVTGTLAKLGDGTLTVLAENGNVVELEAGSLTRIEVSGGRRDHGRSGLLVGLALGVPLGFFLYDDTRKNSPTACGIEVYRECNSSDKLAFVLSGAFLGAAGGWYLGRKGGRETWSPVPLDGLSIAVQPTKGGGRLAVRLSF